MIDCSTDNSKNILKNLLDTDPRKRVFTHLKNLGAWRSRLDGFLYSRAKYIIHFDLDDFYLDNYILEDTYNLITKYTLDSIKFSFIFTKRKNRPFSRYYRLFYKDYDTKIVYGKRQYNLRSLRYGSIWNRLTRTNVILKGIYTLNVYLLNAYKNFWEDGWWNQLINEYSFSYLMINREGYIYMLFKTGEGTIKVGNETLNNKIIREFIYFWLFDLFFLPKEDNKTSIIKKLREFNYTENTYWNKKINLHYLSKKFKPYEYLLNTLIEDNFVSREDKEFVKNLFIEYNNKNLKEEY